MRVTKAKAAENRDALVQTAGRLVRERGIDGVGVAEITEQAGLTTGALYAHFPSKEMLVAEAFSAGLTRSRGTIRAKIAGRKRSLKSYLDYLLAPARRDDPGRSCPMTASASEIGRQGPELSARFADGFLGKAAGFEAVLAPDLASKPRRQLAFTIAAAEIGAMAVARAIVKSDPELSAEVLQAVRAVLLRIADETTSLPPEPDPTRTNR